MKTLLKYVKVGNRLYSVEDAEKMNLKKGEAKVPAACLSDKVYSPELGFLSRTEAVELLESGV